VKVLSELAESFGLDPSVQKMIDGMTGELEELAPFYWNTGQERNWKGMGSLTPIEVGMKPSSIQPPLTHSQEYRQEIRQVGTERYRVL